MFRETKPKKQQKEETSADSSSFDEKDTEIVYTASDNTEKFLQGLTNNKLFGTLKKRKMSDCTGRK